MATIKNLIIFNKSLFDGFSTIVIPALSGIAENRNPNEILRITSAESSWLCKFNKMPTEVYDLEKSIFLQPLVHTSVIHLEVC